MQRINITLPDELARDFRKYIPDRKRSQFIAEALSERLRAKKDLKKEWIKSLKADIKLNAEIQADWAPLDTEKWPD